MTDTEFLRTERAVSPVIGVVLMVAIVVLLVSVAAPSILSGSDSFDKPDASFEWDYQPSNDRVRITHTGGDSIPVSRLYIRGSGFNGAGGGDNSLSGEGSLERALSDDISTGEFVTTGVTSSYELEIVYEEGDQSVVVTENVGPDA